MVEDERVASLTWPGGYEVSFRFGWWWWWVGMGVGVAGGIFFRSWWVGGCLVAANVFLGAWEEERRRTPMIAYVNGQLAARDSTGGDWAEGRRELASVVCRLVAEEMGWVNDRFVPGDLLRVVFIADRDGGSFIHILHRMEGLMGRKVRPDGRRLETMGDLVDSMLTGERVKEGGLES